MRYAVTGFFIGILAVTGLALGGGWFILGTAIGATGIVIVALPRLKGKW